MAALASIVDMMVEAQEIRATVEDGVVWPSRVALYSIMALHPSLNPRRSICARPERRRNDQLPSSRMDYDNPETAPSSNGMSLHPATHRSGGSLC